MVRTAAPIEQRRRSFAGAGRHEGALISPGSARERLVGPEVRWSATRVETYRTCAFQFFGRYGLSLYEVEDELAEADAAIRGTVIHDIMEAALGPLVEDDRPLVPATENEAVRHMRERGRELWLSAPDYYHFGRAALWRLGWEDAANDLERLIHREAIHKRRMARRGAGRRAVSQLREAQGTPPAGGDRSRPRLHRVDAAQRLHPRGQGGDSERQGRLTPAAPR